MSVTYKRYTVLTAALAMALPGLAAAARFSWFDDMPATDSLGQLRTPSSLFNNDTHLAFGIDAYKSLVPGRSGDDGVDAAYLSDATTLRFYGEVSPRTGESIPPGALHPGAADGSATLTSSRNRFSGFGIKLRHRVDASNSVALSAGYSETPWSAQASANLDVLDTRAALSWTSSGTGFPRPGMTSSVFVGDESARDDNYQRLGRRYYGFSVGGELQLSQDHTPYLSYRMRRNLYNPDDPNYLVSPYDDRSQIAAGWKWQVQPNWSLQAEARYGLNGTTLDPYSPDRSRIFFGTRFDFR
jgi:hypothetical protein